jgi:hypothetical protein
VEWFIFLAGYLKNKMTAVTRVLRNMKNCGCALNQRRLKRVKIPTKKKNGMLCKDVT